MSASDAALLKASDAPAFGELYRRDAAAVHGWFAGRMTFLVDARDYTPIELRTHGTGGGTVLRFPVYERLPAPAETRRRLTISASRGGAPVVRDADAYEAAMTKLFPHG
jgi:hypothetical protein